MNNIKNSNESIKIKNIIKDAEYKKSLLLIDMGSLTYQKIRENIIIDKDFDTICTEILELDKIIYNNNKELENINKINTISYCECGNKMKKGDKFCSICGKKSDELIETETIECEFCNQHIELDSIYCVCCGNKVTKVIYE